VALKGGEDPVNTRRCKPMQSTWGKRGISTVSNLALTEQLRGFPECNTEKLYLP